jgi:hypothetical protein
VSRTDWRAYIGALHGMQAHCCSCRSPITARSKRSVQSGQRSKRQNVVQELTFETQYLAAISFVTAILFGNTFGFSFNGQREIVSAMSEEVFALELLLQACFVAQSCRCCVQLDMSGHNPGRTFPE